MNTTLFENITDSLVNYGYIILDNALPRPLCKALIQKAKNESAYKTAGISSSSHQHIDNAKRSDKTLWLDEDSSSQSDYLEFMNSLKEYLNQALYLGLNYYESHFAIYEEGSFYEKHLDSFRGSKNRVVTTVYYLNENYESGDGGELLIYDENDKVIQKVLPNANTLVVFLSEKFPHEVLTAKSKRYSIAGWFRTDKA